MFVIWVSLIVNGITLPAMESVRHVYPDFDTCYQTGVPSMQADFARMQRAIASTFKDTDVYIKIDCRAKK